MPASAINRDTFDRLTGAFRERPGAITSAAEKVGLPKHIARRGWLEGWASRGFPAIRDVIARDEEAAAAARAEVAAELAAQAERRRSDEAAAATAQAERHQLQSDARADARAEAVEVLNDERQLRAKARAVVRDHLQASEASAHAHLALAAELARRIETEAASLSIDQLAALQLTMAKADRQRFSMAREALELERRFRGDPAAMVAVETPPEMTMEEAIRELEEGQRVLQRYRRRGLEVIEGGNEDDGASVGA